MKVKVRLGRPLTFPRVEQASQQLADEVTARIWPCVELQWEWLGGLPRAAQGRRDRRRLDGHRHRRAARARGPRGAARLPRLRARRADRGRAAQRRATCRASSCPTAVTRSRRARSSWRGRRPRRASPCRPARCPPPWAASGARIGERSAVLVLSKGLVPPHGDRCRARYVRERVNARADRLPRGAVPRGRGRGAGRDARCWPAATATSAGSSATCSAAPASTCERTPTWWASSSRARQERRGPRGVGRGDERDERRRVPPAAASSASSSAWRAERGRATARRSPASRASATCSPPRWHRTAATAARASCWPPACPRPP